MDRIIGELHLFVLVAYLMAQERRGEVAFVRLFALFGKYRNGVWELSRERAYKPQTCSAEQQGPYISPLPPRSSLGCKASSGPYRTVRSGQPGRGEQRAMRGAAGVTSRP
jgi:hypothetical protein